MKDLKSIVRRYYNIETYETILKNLLDCFDKHNQDVRWWNNNKYNNNIIGDTADTITGQQISPTFWPTMMSTNNIYGHFSFMH